MTSGTSVTTPCKDLNFLALPFSDTIEDASAVAETTASQRSRASPIFMASGGGGGPTGNVTGSSRCRSCRRTSRACLICSSFSASRSTISAISRFTRKASGLSISARRFRHHPFAA